MKPEFDPEKQFSNGTNPALERYVQGFQNRLLIGRDGPDMITDIGRAWRDERKIEKRIVGGVSVWTNVDG